MTYNVEELLKTAMREEVAGLRAPSGIVARAALGHRRGRRRQLSPLVAVAAATGMAAALVIGVTVTLTGVLPGRSGHHAGRTAGVAVPSPAATSASPSYRVKVLNTSRYRGRTSVETLVDYTGVYDPATRVGQGRRRFATTGALQFQTLRFVGDEYYEQDGRNWRKDNGTVADALGLDGGRRWGPWDGHSADFRALLPTLNIRGTVRLVDTTGTGSASMDRYSFDYAIAGDDSVAAHRMTGTIRVHHASNLIAEISEQTTVVGPQPKIADGDPLTFSTSISFSDYGIPVKVETPPPGAVTELRGAKRI